MKNFVNIEKLNNISKMGQNKIKTRKIHLVRERATFFFFFQFSWEFNFNGGKVNVSDLRLHPPPLVLGRVNCAVALECRFVVSYAPLRLRGACERRILVCVASHSLPRRDPIATCYTFRCVPRLCRAHHWVALASSKRRSSPFHINIYCTKSCRKIEASKKHEMFKRAKIIKRNVIKYFTIDFTVKNFWYLNLR